MHKFGSTGLLSGYIKQLLKSFNLPTIKIYTKEQAGYAQEKIRQHQLTYNERYDVIESQLVNDSDDNDAICYVPYIRDNKLQIYTGGEWKDLGALSTPPHRTYYSRGQRLLNRTKQFQIKNNVYDYYTHEYLGDYLRFIRDYDGINLMPLYNCFSNHLCENLELSFIEPDTNRKVFFDITDDNYKVYMLPVKLFKQYTIAIDSDSAIEMCCGVYNANIITEGVLGEIPKRTYVRKSSSQFSCPFLYDSLVTSLFPALVDENADRQYSKFKEQQSQLTLLAQQERDLKLFIKVPSTVKSSIVVLEGDYRSWNDFVLKSESVPNVESSSTANTDLQVEDFLNKVYPCFNNTFSCLLYKDPISGFYKVKLDGNLSIGKETGEGVLKQTRTQRVIQCYEVNLELKTTQLIVTLDTLDYITTGIDQSNIELESLLATDEQFIGVQPTQGMSFSLDFYEDIQMIQAPHRFEKHYNRTVISNELILSGEEADLISPLQLLRLNTQVQTPFADRLIEYLLDNVIANTDNVIAENVTLAQKLAQLHYLNAGARDGETASADQALVYRYSPQFFGLWDNSLRNIFYQYMTTQTTFETAHDVLGYVDKDVEKLFVAEVKDSKAGKRQQTMLNTDVWEA
jgi:hypothetical protein